MIFADRVRESTTTTGTGTYSLGGAWDSTFVGAVAAGIDDQTVYYFADNFDAAGTDWEVGKGVVTDASPDTLTRATILASSNSGSAVNWGAGTKSIRFHVAAEWYSNADSATKYLVLAIFEADGFIPPASNHPDRVLVQGRPAWAYDDTTVETLRSKQIRVPNSYRGTGTLKAYVFFIMASATSGTVEWEVSVEAITEGDSLDLDAAESFDSANSGSDTVPDTTAGKLGVIAVTLANKDSAAAGDLLRLKVERDADDGTNDTASGDARLCLVALVEEY